MSAVSKRRCIGDAHRSLGGGKRFPRPCAYGIGTFPGGDGHIEVTRCIGKFGQEREARPVEERTLVCSP